jgi:hypothetical protein
MYLDYGFTRPNVISRGPYQQLTGEGCEEGCAPEGMSEMGPAGEPMNGPQEVLPPPEVPHATSAKMAPSSRGAVGSHNALPATNILATDGGQPRRFDERQANNPAAETARNTPVWEWAER